ncbi:MAG TPA: hypothetical protein VFM70_12485 [Salinimicrobium sp.]|nr:hypothetical protein [Salinimicrobium sp.]
MKKIIILTLIGFTILSCSSDNYTADIDNDYSEYITGNLIDTDINFMPEEIFMSSDTPQSPSLKLKLITVEPFPCVNYGLTTTQFENKNELIIRFDEILEPVICFTSPGPGVSYIDLTQNINKVTFINGNVIDQYSIEINQEKIIITPIETNFSNSLYNKTFRIPENSFAYVCGTNTDNTNIYTDFAAIIEQNPDFMEFEFEGEGRIPYPETTDGHWVNHPSKFYKYSSFEEFNNLDNVLNDFSSENIEENSGVTISITSWNNARFFSWD